jgi:lysozyme family protein
MKKIIEWIIRHEGSVANTLDDGMGITKFGITKVAVLDWAKSTGRMIHDIPAFIRNMSFDTATDIYLWYLNNYFKNLIMKYKNDEASLAYILDKGINLGPNDPFIMILNSIPQLPFKVIKTLFAVYYAANVKSYRTGLLNRLRDDYRP